MKERKNYFNNLFTHICQLVWSLSTNLKNVDTRRDRTEIIIQNDARTFFYLRNLFILSMRKARFNLVKIHQENVLCRWFYMNE